jgi:iron complex outermembrane recepter protein
MKRSELCRAVDMTAKTKSYLFCTAAVAALALAASVQPAAAADTDQMETVVVTGQRAAIASAIQVKESSDVIVDSVSAEDVGRLPDNSITEVLQRIAGVNVTHIITGGSSETFTGEGTGIQIRGLTNVVSQLNGRDSFSAINGRNLAWEDIPPELAQGVDVYKSLSAVMPEGGFGGTVNLRTRQPFDFDGFTAAATVTGNFADYSQKGHIGGVGLISDRWTTSSGEFGLLLNVAYSDLATRADGIQVAPYFPQVWDPGLQSSTIRLPYLGDPGAKEVYVPGGVNFNRSDNDRQRLGLYAAFQWRPSEQLDLFATIFRSRYTSNSLVHAMYVNGSANVVLTPDSNSTFDTNGNLTSTSGMSNFMYVGSADLGSGTASGWGYQPIPYDFQAYRDHSVNTTTDYSVGGTWQPSNDFQAKFAIQFVDSRAQQENNGAFAYAFLADYSLSLSPYGSAKTPTMTMSENTIDLANGGNFTWLSTMDHLRNDRGQEYAAYVDTIYTISDKGFFRSLKTGIKATYRNERDYETNWNNKDLTPWWGSGINSKGEYESLFTLGGFHYLSDDPAFAAKYDLSTLFNGQTGLPSAIMFPTEKALTTDYTTMHQKFGAPGDTATAIQFAPTDLSKITEASLSGYAQVDFADEDHFLVPFNGNFGLRVVAYRDHAHGFFQIPAISFPTAFVPVTDYVPTGSPNQIRDPGYSVANTLLFTSKQSITPGEGGHSQVDVLPSINLQFLPSDHLHIRLAFSQGVSRPGFWQMDPRGGAYGNYVGTYESYFTGGAGNPNLKPEEADQFDGSIEYYFPSGGQVHISPFYKRIHNFISTKRVTRDVSLPLIITGGAKGRTYNGVTDLGCPDVSYNAACSLAVPTDVTEYFNESQTAEIDGYEVGLQKYASFLPAPFDGLGVDINYTYIDSKQPGALAFDIHGNKINNLPLTGLSKNTYNASLMFDKGPISFRLAYNWRDDFLVSTAAWETSGTYNYLNDLPPIGGQTAGQQGRVTSFALPVFQYPSGSLDLNFTYSLTDNVAWTLEASNLMQEVSRLYMGIGSERNNRSWYVADTRYTTQIRVKF